MNWDRGFADRVMAAIAQEPAPTPTRNLLTALRTRSIRDAASVVAVAWHLGTVRRWHVAHAVRVRAIALVLSVVCALGVSGSLAAAAAVQVAGPVIGNFNQHGPDVQGPNQNNPSGTDEQGPRHNNASGTDEQGPNQNHASGAGEQGANQNDPSGTDEQGPAQNHSAGTNERGSSGSPSGTNENGPAGSPSGTDQNGSSGNGSNP